MSTLTAPTNGVHLEKPPQPKTDIITLIRRAVEKKELIRKVLISPDMADRIITQCVSPYIRQRKLKPRTLKKYTEDMEKDRWHYQGNMVKISESMGLLDGQHSLHAVRASGKGQVFNIECGLPDSSFSVMDNGATRSGADIMSIIGVKSAFVTAAAIKAYIYFKTAQSVGSKVSENRVSHQTLASWEGTPQLKRMEEAVEEANNFYYPISNRLLAPGTWAFLHYLLTKISKEYGEDFLSSLATGENISRTHYSAIWHLKQKLQAMRNSIHSTTTNNIDGGKPMEVKMKYIMTAWNHYIKDEEIQKLTIDNKNPIPQPERPRQK